MRRVVCVNVIFPASFSVAIRASVSVGSATPKYSSPSMPLNRIKGSGDGKLELKDRDAIMEGRHLNKGEEDTRRKLPPTMRKEYMSFIDARGPRNDSEILH